MNAKPKADIAPAQSGQHTRGPWKSAPTFRNDEYVTVTGPRGEHICTCDSAISGNVRRNKANARFIAAAPDMEKEIEILKAQKAELIEALRNCEAELSLCVTAMGYIRDEPNPTKRAVLTQGRAAFAQHTAEQARAAIAKAERGQQ